MHSQPAFTRRRALALGALAGAGAILARTPAPSLASGVSLFGMPARTGQTLRAPRGFDLVGLRGLGNGHAHVEIRTRPLDGRWTKWMPVHQGGDHGPNGGGAHSSDPIWVDGARELQLRGSLPARARLQFVAVSALSRRAAVRSANRFGARAALRQASAAPTIVPRAAWGARAFKGTPSYGEVQIAVVHHTVSANDYAPEAVPAMLQAIQTYHMDSNGWSDIGYNFLVDRFGRIWEGRQGGIDQPVIGAQAQGWNDDSTGISNIGTFSAVAQTPEAIEANARLIAWKLSVHGAPVEGAVPLVSGGGPENNYPAGTVVPFQRISGHRDVGKTECPGGALYAQLPQIRARAAQIAPEYANVKGRLTLARSASAVRYGDTLTLTGQLHRFDGSPVVGVAVWAQKRGTSSWVPMTKGFTSADGSYSITIPWRASGRLRTHAVVDDGIAVSAAATVECIPQLSQMKKARVARRATVKGKVRPAETFKVLLERQTGGRYRKIGTYSVKARKSAFKAKLPLRRAGRYKLTPVVKIGTKTFKGKSALLRALG